MSAVAHFRESLAIIVFAVELDRFELNRNVANPFGATFGSDVTNPTSRYVDVKFGQQRSGMARTAKIIALSHHCDAAIGKKPATPIPSAAIKASPRNGCRGIFIVTRELVG